MAVTIPNIDGLTELILNDIATMFGVDANSLGITYIVPAKAQAAQLYLSYLLLSTVQRNVNYDLAEESVLIRYGKIILDRTPAPAESGIYTVEVTGNIGAVIPASTQFKANDDTLAAGYLFILDSQHIMVSETETIELRALTPGTTSRLYVDDLLTSTSPIAGVDSEGKVTVVTTEPVAAESLESYRADVVEAARLEPQGGAPSDYRLWCSEIPEIRKVYPYAKAGNPGDIQIYIEATVENTAPAEVIGVPKQETIDEVYTAPSPPDPESGIVVINPTTGKGRKPITVYNIESLPVDPVPVDVYLTGLTDESLADDIKTAISNLLYEIRPFVSGADFTNEKNDILTIGQITAVIISVLSGTGATYTTLTMTVDRNTETSYQFLLGYYPYLNILYNDGSPIGNYGR